MTAQEIGELQLFEFDNFRELVEAIDDADLIELTRCPESEAFTRNQMRHIASVLADRLEEYL